VAVSPDHQDQGIGRALMAAVTGGLGKQETMPLVLIGDPEYYERHFGFNSKYTSDWQLPGPYEQHRLLAICPQGDRTPRKGILGPYGSN
jgi:predicted N-acetyltransferase YhbS